MPFLAKKRRITSRPTFACVSLPLTMIARTNNGNCKSLFASHALFYIVFFSSIARSICPILVNDCRMSNKAKQKQLTPSGDYYHCLFFIFINETQSQLIRLEHKNYDRPSNRTADRPTDREGSQGSYTFIIIISIIIFFY